MIHTQITPVRFSADNNTDWQFSDDPERTRCSEFGFSLTGITKYLARKSKESRRKLYQESLNIFVVVKPLYFQYSQIRQMD